jgi:hypothetical protein
VAVSKPSHSVRPGSLMWTWVSTRPGISTSSSPSTTSSVASRSEAKGSIRTTRPSFTPIARSTSPTTVITRGARKTTSSIVASSGVSAGQLE